MMQMLHQMYTTSTSYAVFVSATESCVCSTVVVRLPDSIKAVVVSELAQLSGIVSWAHSGTFDEIVNRIPRDIERCDLDIIKSHLPFWCLVNAHVLGNGPFAPLKLFKNAVQSFYSKTKPGVDGLTQNREVLANASSGLKWEQMIATKGLQTCAVNAHIMYKLHHMKHYAEDRDLFVNLSTFRANVAHVEGFSTFCFKGAIELLCTADTLSQEAAPIQTMQPMTIDPGIGARSVKRHRLRHWNLPENKALR